MKRHIVLITLAMLYWLAAGTMAKAQDLLTVETSTVYRLEIDGIQQSFGDVPGPAAKLINECEAMLEPLFVNALGQIQALFPDNEFRLSVTQNCRDGEETVSYRIDNDISFTGAE